MPLQNKKNNKINSVNSTENPGIYLHIPFCEKKCGYCDFYSVTDFSYRAQFIKAIKTEISNKAKSVQPNSMFDTIYFGGGTPSLLTLSELSELLETIYKNFKISSDVEITLEANPGTNTENTFKEYFDLGINRLSIGIQSFNEQELKFLGRIHDATQAEQTVQRARSAGFDNFSLDLIFAIPGQTINSWQETLSKTFELQPTHISAYNLIYEEGTPFYKQLINREIKAKSEKEEITFWQHTLQEMQGNGYPAYEVSNFARSSELYSRHNIKYWTHSPYLGFGPSAHSFWNLKRWSNVSNINEYIDRLDTGKSASDSSEVLDDATFEFEHIFLNLRMYAGLNLTTFKNIFNSPFCEKYKQECNDLLEHHYAVIEKDMFKLTEKGMIICDAILPEFYRA